MAFDNPAYKLLENEFNKITNGKKEENKSSLDLLMENFEPNKQLEQEIKNEDEIIKETNKEINGINESLVSLDEILKKEVTVFNEDFERIDVKNSANLVQPPKQLEFEVTEIEKIKNNYLNGINKEKGRLI